MAAPPSKEIIRIEVLDTGIGLPMDQDRKIFDEFHQLANPARDSSLGLGLGLSIVKRIGDLLGHSIDVRSIPGYGSAFAVEVQIGDAGEVDETQPIRAAQENSAPVAGTFLIIDDDPIVRNMVKMLLDQEGHRTMVAGDVATALDIAGTNAAELDLVARLGPLVQRIGQVRQRIAQRGDLPVDHRGHVAVGADQAGIDEAELGDGGRDLGDLLVRVLAGVPRVGQ